MPSEHNILSHQATQWIESAEALLRGKGLWEVAQGGLPSAARNIVDTPISTLPPPGGVISRKDDQDRLNILAQNERNRLKREELMLTSWNQLYVAILFAAEKHCPLFHESLKNACFMTVHNPAWGEFRDGPLAWRMALHVLEHSAHTVCFTVVS